jgi:hypothetical protein
VLTPRTSDPGVVAVFLHAGHGKLQQLQLAEASLLVLTAVVTRPGMYISESYS